MSCNTKCHDLAYHFLQDYEPQPVLEIAELAQRIQDVVEAYLEERREHNDAKRQELLMLKWRPNNA